MWPVWSGQFRQDGAQRDLVRDDGLAGRGAETLCITPISVFACREVSKLATLENLEFYQYDIDIPAVAGVWMREQCDQFVAPRFDRVNAARIVRSGRVRRASV